MKHFLLKLKPIFSLVFVGVFSAIAVGQVAPQISAPNPREMSPFELIGWIALTGAGITHVATNIYNLVRGKNYDQIKEACANYKELADSRMAVIKAHTVRIHTLEAENERVLEMALRPKKKGYDDENSSS